MSLGRPVLPPEAIDFQHGDTACGSGPSDNAGSGTKPTGTLGIPGLDRPTNSARGRSSILVVNETATVGSNWLSDGNFDGALLSSSNPGYTDTANPGQVRGLHADPHSGWHRW